MQAGAGDRIADLTQGAFVPRERSGTWPTTRQVSGGGRGGRTERSPDPHTGARAPRLAAATRESARFTTVSLASALQCAPAPARQRRVKNERPANAPSRHT